MKKIIAISLTVVMLFALAVPAVAHIWYTTEQNTTGFINVSNELPINAGKLPADATVELGKSDPDWKYAYPYVLNKAVTRGSYNSAVDADVYVMYDQTNLYIREVRRDTIKSGDYSIYRFILPGKELTVGTKTPAGAYVQINFNAAAGDTAAANEVKEANTLGYAWAPNNTSVANTYLSYTDIKASISSYAVKASDGTFVVETAIPLAKIGDGTALNYDYIGFKHRTTTNGGSGSAYHQITSLSNVGTNHADGAKTYHNDWDNFVPMYLRSYVNDEAAASKIDISWYNDTDTEFTITTAGQLRGLSTIIAKQGSKDAAKAITAGKTFKLGANIDLNPNWERTDGTEPAYYWLPMACFEGTFDGQGYAIDDVICVPSYNTLLVWNTSFDDSVQRAMGFIGHVYGSATVKNLIMTDVESTTNYSGAGLIAKVLSGAKVNVSNLYIDADVLMDTSNPTGNGNNNWSASGIVLGRGESNSADWAKIENVVVKGNLKMIIRKDGTSSTGNGPICGVNSGSTPTLTNVLVALDSNTNNKYDPSTGTVGGGDGWRIKNIADGSAWVKTNTFAVNPSTGAFLEGGTAYPEGWIKADEDSNVMMPATVAEMVSRNLWIQETAVDTATNTFSVRILTGIDSLEWDALGLKVEMKVGNNDFVDISADIADVKDVYTSIVAAGAETPASALNGAKYVGGVVLTNISAAETVTFKVTPIKYIGKTAYINAHASTVTYVNGVLQK